MHDRVVDRAAAHGEPADLAVRDWLLVGLSFSAGMYEAICFLTFGKVFAGFQTGNLVLLGVGVARTAPPAGPNAVMVIVSLAAFAAGAALAMPILKAFSGGQATGHNVFPVWPRPVSITLAIALIPQAAFLAVWITAASPARLAYVLIALAAFAMGLQINAVRSLHVPGISTTAFTATFVGLVSGLIAELWSSRVHEPEAHLERDAPRGYRIGSTPAAQAADPPEYLPEPLSQAEARVLRFLPTSLSAPEIARELYVSVNTVRTHMRHLYDKLGAHRRLDAIDRARALGLLAPVPRRALRSLREYRAG